VFNAVFALNVLETCHKWWCWNFVNSLIDRWIEIGLTNHCRVRNTLKIKLRRIWIKAFLININDNVTIRHFPHKITGSLDKHYLNVITLILCTIMFTIQPLLQINDSVVFPMLFSRVEVYKQYILHCNSFSVSPVHTVKRLSTMLNKIVIFIITVTLPVILASL